jgi:hypothetical protein
MTRSAGENGLSVAPRQREHGDMVLVRETVMADWQALRDIRLEALRDAPHAFG